MVLKNVRYMLPVSRRSYSSYLAPALFRRRALASLSDSKNELVFASRPRTRMQISLRTSPLHDKETFFVNTIKPYSEHASVEAELAMAQTEIVDQEIFTYLVKEASVLPTVLARVSERSIIIDAAENIELRFDLVRPFLLRQASSLDHHVQLKDEDIFPAEVSPTCDIIYHGLHVLLLRKHTFQKTERFNSSSATGVVPLGSYSPAILQPIIDFLQYNLFCERLEAELNKAAKGLVATGIPAEVEFTGVGETGEELVKVLTEPRSQPISGEAMLTIAERYNHLPPLHSDAHPSADIPSALRLLPRPI